MRKGNIQTKVFFAGTASKRVNSERLSQWGWPVALTGDVGVPYDGAEGAALRGARRTRGEESDGRPVRAWVSLCSCARGAIM